MKVKLSDHSLWQAWSMNYCNKIPDIYKKKAGKLMFPAFLVT